MGIMFTPLTGVLVAGLAKGIFGGAEGEIKQGADASSTLKMMGSYQLNQWNYKETNTSTYTWETLNCQRCTRAQFCTSTKKPFGGSRYCKAWGPVVETCKDIQF